MLDKIKQFFVERAKWAKAGKPYRSDDRIIEIFNICNSNQCEQYEKINDDEGNCGICGCRLTRTRQYLSKNSWQTTNCPHETPFWFADILGQEPTIEEVNILIKEEQEGKIIESPPEQPKGGCGCGGR